MDLPPGVGDDGIWRGSHGVHADLEHAVESFVQKREPLAGGAVAAVDDPAPFVQLFEEDVVPRTVVVVDDDQLGAFIEGCAGGGVDLVGEEFVHPVAVPDVFDAGILPVFLETEPGDAFDVRLDIDFHLPEYLRKRYSMLMTLEKAKLFPPGLRSRNLKQGSKVPAA